MFRIGVSTCAFLLVLFAFNPRASFGQVTAGGTVAGTVTDNTGAAVVGATVTLIDKATNNARAATTNTDRHYIFPDIPPGNYDLHVTQQGFNEVILSNLAVNVGSSLTENVKMQVGAVKTTVTVTETPPAAELQTMNSTIGNTVTGTALENLPALGRDASTFVTLQPGVSPSGDVAGAVSDQSTFMLDGGNNTDDMSGNNTVYLPDFRFAMRRSERDRLHHKCGRSYELQFRSCSTGS